jgi:hypothetical protein
VRDAHLRVSAPPSSRLMAVPFGGDRSQHVDDLASGGGRAVARGPSRSASSTTTADPATTMPDYDSRVVGADEVFFPEADEGSGGGCQGRYPTP